jgi:hypothetical protein
MLPHVAMSVPDFRAVLGHELLAGALRNPLTHRTRNYVIASAWRKSEAPALPGAPGSAARSWRHRRRDNSMAFL